MRLFNCILILWLTACHNKPSSPPADIFTTDNTSSFSSTGSKPTITGNSLDSPFLYLQDVNPRNQVSTIELKGKCLVFYASDSMHRYIYLKKGNKTKLLARSGIDNTFAETGLVLRDFQDAFLLGHFNGNGGLYNAELIGKKDLKNLLGETVCLLRCNADNKIAWVSNTNRIPQDFFIYDLQLHKKEKYPFPFTLSLPNFHCLVDFEAGNFSDKDFITRYSINDDSNFAFKRYRRSDR